MTNMEPNKGEIVMYQPDETIRLEVRVENETVWLTQQQMAELFNATKQNISLHINNIYDEGELEQIATVKDYLTVQKEGKRMVKRHHDRFLIIDDAVYIFGASLKDAGKKLFAYIRMQETSATELLSIIR